MYLGIEIGGTKLQIGLGPGDGTILGLWRSAVNVTAGGEGIRNQILAAVPELLGSAHLSADQLLGVGVGFGGPVDDKTQRIIKSHQIPGWDDFPLPQWLGEASISHAYWATMPMLPAWPRLITERGKVYRPSST